MHPTLSSHGNILLELTAELERESGEAKRRGDRLIIAAAGLKGDELLNATSDASYRRGAQDALTNVVGRLRSILAAPLGVILDLGEVFDEVEAKVRIRSVSFSDKPELVIVATPAEVATLVAEVLDGLHVGGKRRTEDVDLDAAIERAERYGEPIPGEVTR